MAGRIVRIGMFLMAAASTGAVGASGAGLLKRAALGDLELGRGWIYDDLGAGYARARETGKPLLVVLRCVP